MWDPVSIVCDDINCIGREITNCEIPGGMKSCIIQHTNNVIGTKLQQNVRYLPIVNSTTRPNLVSVWGVLGITI